MNIEDFYIGQRVKSLSNTGKITYVVLMINPFTQTVDVSVEGIPTKIYHNCNMYLFKPAKKQVVTQPPKPVPAGYEKTGFIWGTYNQKEYVPKNLKQKDLGELTTAHLLNILITETWHMPMDYICKISEILRKRGIHFQDGDFN